MFLDLPKIRPQLDQWLTERNFPQRITSNIADMLQNLTSRCITRDLTWGTPVPRKDLEGKVFYVWFDAPIGYISITAGYTDEYRQWWENPNVEIVQFMGVDNVSFHTVMFPATLLGTGDKWPLRTKISATNYLLYGGQKFSKGNGVGVFGTDAIASGVPADMYRYYLASIRPETADSSFSERELALHSNEFANVVGNFVNRVITFVGIKFSGIIESGVVSSDASLTTIVSEINVILKQYAEHMENLELRSALSAAMSLARLGNSWLSEKAPWDLIKEGHRNAAADVMILCVNLIYVLAQLLSPFVPSMSEEIFRQLGVNVAGAFFSEFRFNIKRGHTVGMASVLVRKTSGKKN